MTWPAWLAWLPQLFVGTGTAHSILLLALAAATGVALGSLKIRGVGLGVAGVLFSGLIFGHFGMKLEHEVLEFAREFGLIIFVYTIGVQVGPGFFASFRKDGLGLNLMAACVVLLGVGVTLGSFYLFMDRGEFAAAVGLFSGATTNTPSLAAAQAALKGAVPDAGVQLMPGLGYAVAYPFGIMGIILTMLAIRVLFRINIQSESEELRKKLAASDSQLATINLEVKNPSLAGMKLADVPVPDGAVVSRVMHLGKAQVANGSTTLDMGDVLLAVGSKTSLDRMRVLVGGESKTDVKSVPSAITSRRILVTRSSVIGRSVPELNFNARFGVTVTRVTRGEVELSPTGELPLKFGDTLVAVGEAESIAAAAKETGDSIKRLNHPQVIPIFVGLVLGVIVGSLPLPVPGIPAPVKLGLAGGPLLVAILLSWLGNIGPVVWYMPSSANFMMREVGISLFLAAVGLNAGERFIPTITQGHGVQWMLVGALITVVPLMTVGVVARAFFRLNYLQFCGLVSGSMTDPPALAFAGSMTGSEMPHVSYAAVYPLTMLLRVLSAQAMVLLYFR